MPTSDYRTLALILMSATVFEDRRHIRAPSQKRLSALFPGRCLLFKNVRSVTLLVAVLAPVPGTVLHFDVPRQSVGGDLQLSGIARLVSLSLHFASEINAHVAGVHYQSSRQWALVPLPLLSKFLVVILTHVTWDRNQRKMST